MNAVDCHSVGVVGRSLANSSLVRTSVRPSAGERTIGMPSFVARSLAANIDLYALPGAEGLVFPSADSQPMRRSNLRSTGWGYYRGRYPVPRLEAHRGTFAAARGTRLKASRLHR